MDDGHTGKLVRCPDCTDWLAHSRLTPEEQAHTLDDIADRDDDSRGEMLALRFLGKEMLADPFGFLSIWGKKGGGKSLLLTALIAEFCRAGRNARYFNAGEIVSLLSPGDDKEIDGFRHVAGNPDACKAALKAVPVLAIDEVDKLKWTAWQVQQIGEVIEHRHRHAESLVTLFAMNRPPWEWQNAGEVEHIASRLSDGRFYRRWPDDKLRWLPKCAGSKPELPGLFEVTLADIRPRLRRW
ncbi:MAG: ATP-binding protein [Caldilineaceae bacterium]|nr:ATP-binding protein [Caldilineaceae bacterium]